MKAALTVRNQVLLLSEIELAKKTCVEINVYQFNFFHSFFIFYLFQNSAATSSNPDAVFILEVFQGTFLDTKYLSPKYAPL